MNTALIVGVTGIAGSALAESLVADGWKVLGLARNPERQEGVKPIAADLLDEAALRGKLSGAKPMHVFITSWLRQDTEAESIRVNGAMVRNILTAVGPAGVGPARCVGHGPEALPRTLRGLWERRPAQDAVPREPGSARRR